MAAPWDVLEHPAVSDRAYLVGRFQILRYPPEPHSLWPADALLQVEYSLSGPTALDDRHRFQPHGRQPALRIRNSPVLSLSPDGNPARTRVILPASKFWILKDFLPADEIRPVDARLDFRDGKSRKGLDLVDVLRHSSTTKSVAPPGSLTWRRRLNSS
jgi:aldose 1-epimerase